MSESLRIGLVEAMAEGFYEADDCYRDSWESQPEPGVKDWYRRMARSALGRALGFLSTNAEAWTSQAAAMKGHYIVLETDLIAVLRDRDRPEET